MVDRIRSSRINGIKSDKDNDEHEGRNPGVLQGISFPLLKEGPGFPSLGERFLAVSVTLRLHSLKIYSIIMWSCAYLQRAR